MKKVKTFLFKVNFFNRLKHKGYFVKNIRRQIIVNFIYQRLFGLNRECKHSVHFTSTVQVPQNLYIGKNVEKSLLISGHCYIQATNGIFIGDNTIFAPGVKLISSNHDFSNLTFHKKEKPIRIGKNCWLGANVIVLPGVELGDNTIVGAGSVVTKSYIEGNAIIAGNPCKVLNQLNG